MRSTSLFVRINERHFERLNVSGNVITNTALESGLESDIWAAGLRPALDVRLRPDASHFDDGDGGWRVPGESGGLWEALSIIYFAKTDPQLGIWHSSLGIVILEACWQRISEIRAKRKEL